VRSPFSTCNYKLFTPESSESAGGIAVDLYAFVWTKDPIINGFIAQSGTALLRVSGVKVGDFSEWYSVSKKLGCGGPAAGEKTISCMQGKKYEDILTSWTSSPDFSKSNAFGVYPDNRTAWSDFFTRGRKGEFVKRVSLNISILNSRTDAEWPLLVGHNNLESGLFRFLQERVGKTNERALQVIDEGYACPPGAAASYRTTHGVNAWR
jgi:cholinesterase